MSTELSENSVQRAARIAGGQSALARAVGVTPQAVQKWCAAGEVPPSRALPIEKVSGVSRSELCPAIYPPETATAT
jgi:DNA-binding transcriptional regulator YdaS (Cro superfamily)